MGPEPGDHGSNLRRRALVVAAAIIAIGIVSLLFLIQPKINSAIAPRSTPSPPSLPKPWIGPCPPTQLSFTGIFQECVSMDNGLSCPNGSFDQARVTRLHGTKHDFLLYVEVNGGYRGPGTYALAPWPHHTLGVPDGVAKVAIRDTATGSLWESTAGSVTIDTFESGGWLYAGLGASAYSPVDVGLRIAGWWSCS